MGAYNSWSDVLGLGTEPRDLDILQVCLRGFIVFVAALVMVRMADKRFLSKMTPFDVVLGFMLASVLARAINGSGPLVPTLGVGFLLVGLHRLSALLALRSDRFGNLVKGRECFLVQNGRLNERAMRANDISHRDLLEAARQEGKVESLDQIQTAVLERSGHISVIPSRGGG